jgi:cation:H+ antiporter
VILSIFLILLGFVLLIKGADFLVDGSSDVAKKFHIPEIIIGLTIVSIGTSMPELFVSSTSTLNGSSDMAIGNIIGSNLCNLLLILGLSTIIRPVKFQRETRLIEIPMCLFITIIFVILCNNGLEITRFDAVILIAMFVLFILYTIVMGIKGENFDKEDEPLVEIQTDTKQVSIWKSIFYIIIGIIGLKIGGDLTVNNATEIARQFNISEKVISLTILAIGTSLPELVTSVTAAIKGNSDIAIGNIIGSNIFNMLLIIGISALISPLSYNITYNIQMAILIVAMIVLALFPVIPPKNEMSRANGIVYLIMYIAYMAMLFAM